MLLLPCWTARGISGWATPEWFTIIDCFAKTHRSSSRLCGCWTPPPFLPTEVRTPDYNCEGGHRWNLLKQAGPDGHSPPEPRTGTIHWWKQFHPRWAAQSRLCHNNNWQDSEGWGLVTRALSTMGWAMGTRPGAKACRGEMSQHLYWIRVCFCYFTCSWSHL